MIQHIFQKPLWKYNSKPSSRTWRYSYTAFLLVSSPGAYLILKLQGASFIGERYSKEGGTYFNVRRVIQMKFQTFAIVSFQIKCITTIMICSRIYFRTTSYLNCFIICILVPYAFKFSCSWIMVGL